MIPVPAVPLLTAVAIFVQPVITEMAEIGAEVLERIAPPVVPWAELAEIPEASIDREARVFVQFHSLSPDFEPYLTRFGRDAFLGLNAWSDEQRPWVREDYENPAVDLFVRRGSEAELALLAGERHDRFMLVCVVREFFLGRAWVEVTHARRMRSHIPEGTVLHAIRAFTFYDNRAWRLAQDHFARALAAPLPAAAAGELARMHEASAAKHEAWEAEKVAQSQTQAGRRPGTGAPAAKRAPAVDDPELRKTINVRRVRQSRRVPR